MAVALTPESESADADAPVAHVRTNRAEVAWVVLESPEGGYLDGFATATDDAEVEASISHALEAVARAKAELESRRRHE